jgi:hypothetical protein
MAPAKPIATITIPIIIIVQLSLGLETLLLLSSNDVVDSFFLLFFLIEIYRYYATPSEFILKDWFI